MASGHKNGTLTLPMTGNFGNRYLDKFGNILEMEMFPHQFLRLITIMFTTWVYICV